MLDTLSLARKMHPGQRNSLDALCKRYAVDASNRDVHGALIDSDLLARVYLAMTGGQTAMLLDDDHIGRQVGGGQTRGRDASSPNADGTSAGDPQLIVVRATDEEVAAHEAILERIASIHESLN